MAARIGPARACPFRLAFARVAVAMVPPRCAGCFRPGPALLGGCAVRRQCTASFGTPSRWHMSHRVARDVVRSWVRYVGPGRSSPGGAQLRPGSPPRCGCRRRSGVRLAPSRSALAARPGSGRKGSAGACRGARYPRTRSAIGYTRTAHIGYEAGRCAKGELHGRAATSPASIGWNRNPDGTGITGSLAICLTAVVRSWNWVARNVVHGKPESATIRSARNFAPVAEHRPVDAAGHRNPVRADDRDVRQVPCCGG